LTDEQQIPVPRIVDAAGLRFNDAPRFASVQRGRKYGAASFLRLAKIEDVTCVGQKERESMILLPFRQLRDRGWRPAG
jgi:hypothetical protein